jgi:hypothetical protein
VANAQDLVWDPISDECLNVLKQNPTTIVKNFLYSNVQGFQNGSYLIAYNAQKQLRLKSKSLKFLTLWNKTNIKQYCAWYLCKAANEPYNRSSPIKSIEPAASKQIFSRTSEGRKSLINLASTALLGTQTEPLLVFADSDTKLIDELLEKELTNSSYTIKDFTTSNWERFEKGDFFLCKKYPLDNSDASLSCNSCPKTITISNTTQTPFYFVFYADMDIGQLSKNYSFFHAGNKEKHFVLSRWEKLIKPGCTVEMPNPTNFNEGNTLYFGQDKETLKTEKLLTIAPTQVGTLRCGQQLSAHRYTIHNNTNTLTLKPYEETN